MPKSKLLGLLNDKKKGRQAPPQPTTADEFLEAGVDLQEAGEKWRGGDAKKSTRFFVKALDCYEEGLKKFPASFEIAFNRAQIQYQFTQYPKLLKELSASLLDLLQTALESSRYALNLKQDNPDVLFNTAQVLASLAEAIVASPRVSQLQPVALLEESLDLFQRCLALQEYLYTESQAQAEAAMDTSDLDQEDGGASLSPEQQSIIPPAAHATDQFQTEQEEQWATIVEPVTNETLVDTIMAQLEVLILLCGMVAGDGKRISFIEEYSSPLISMKLAVLLKATRPEVDMTASIGVATFNCALADANFICQRTDAATYGQVLANAWSAVDFSQQPEALVGAAESRVAFNASLRQHPDSHQPEYLSARWKALTSAQEALAAASKLPGVSNIEKIHLLRGDVDIFRFQLGKGKNAFDSAIQSASVLCKNAEKYYRGAKREAASVSEIDVMAEAGVKEGLAKSFGGLQKGLSDAVKEVGEFNSIEVLKDAIDGGIVDEDQLRAMGLEHL